MAADPVAGAGVASRAVLQVRAGVADPKLDLLAEEVPVGVYYDGVPFAVMMASPGDLVDFAHGFSLTERGISSGDIAAVEMREVLEGMVLDIRTTDPAAAIVSSDQARLMPGRSGCGICGNRLLEDVVRQPVAVGKGGVLAAQALELALAALQERQPLNAATGAIHAAAWCDVDGTVLQVREDVGRHNALDKLIGAMLRAGIAPTTGFALVTSRASYEMVTKAAIAGIPLLAAISAPTALAVDLAQSCGLTLVGFVRPGRHVVYSHPWRLRGRARQAGEHAS